MKLNSDNIDQSQTPMGRAIKEALPTIVITTTPVLIAGVNRKVNVGNYENVDIYCGVSLPMPGASLEDLETLQKMVEDTATLAFGLASEQAGNRYTAIKELQKGRQDKKPVESG